MKRYTSLMAIVILCVIGMMATMPLFAQEKEWSLVGTWVNPAYENSNATPPQNIFKGDGTITTYYHIGDSLPWGVGTYSVESDWTEPGVHWFKVKSTFSQWTYFEIAKLTNEGNTYESVGSWDKYPSSFDKSNNSYLTRNRRE